MAEETATTLEQEQAATEKPKKEKKAKAVKEGAEPKEKKEPKLPSIPADSVFRALSNNRNRGESLRTKVYNALALFESATAQNVGDEMKIETRVALGNMRSLVYDGKAELVGASDELQAKIAALRAERTAPKPKKEKAAPEDTTQTTEQTEAAA